ncbi:hypothetical protein [Caenimonas koreensis]|nr:hypothetical protein [Caenimonas koreensis]
MPVKSVTPIRTSSPASRASCDGKSPVAGDRPLELPQPLTPQADGLPPLRLHVADAAPEPQGANADKAAKAGNTEKNRAKKQRQKANKASMANRPLAKLSAQVAECSASAGSRRRFLMTSADGELTFSDRFLEFSEAQKLKNHLIRVVQDELLFATRHLPFAQRWALNYEHSRLAKVLVYEFAETDPAFTRVGAKELLVQIGDAVTLQDPAAVEKRCQRMKLVSRAMADKRILYGQARIMHLFTCMVEAIDSLLVEPQPEPRPIGPIHSRSDIDALFSFAMDETAWDVAETCAVHISNLVQLVCLARRDFDVAQYLMEFAIQLPEVAANQDESEILETLSVGLLVLQSPQFLRKLVVTQEELKWIQAHIAVLVGYLGESMTVDQAHRQQIRPSHFNRGATVERVSMPFIETDRGKNLAAKLLEMTRCLTLVNDAETRIEKLVELEQSLQRVDSQIDFEGMPLDELLDAFVPQTRQQSDVTHLHEPRLLAYVDGAPGGEEADGKAPPAVEALAAAGSADAGQAPALAPEETLEYWLAKWQALKRKYPGRSGPGAASRTQPSQPEQQAEVKYAGPTASAVSASEPDSRSKQPGSKPRASGYQHHLPKADKHLPNTVSKARMKAIFERKGKKYTPEMRRKALERIREQTVQVVD